MTDNYLTLGFASYLYKYNLLVGLIFIVLKTLEYLFDDSFGWIDSILLICGFIFLSAAIWYRRSTYITVGRDTLTIYRFLLANKVIELEDLHKVYKFAGDLKLMTPNGETTLDSMEAEDQDTLISFLKSANLQADIAL
jgi:hypothetical protein